MRASGVRAFAIIEQPHALFELKNDPILIANNLCKTIAKSLHSLQGHKLRAKAEGAVLLYEEDGGAW